MNPGLRGLLKRVETLEERQPDPVGVPLRIFWLPEDGERLAEHRRRYPVQEGAATGPRSIIFRERLPGEPLSAAAVRAAALEGPKP